MGDEANAVAEEVGEGGRWRAFEQALRCLEHQRTQGARVHFGEGRLLDSVDLGEQIL